MVSLAHAFVITSCDKKGQALLDKMAEGVKILKQVYSELPCYDIIIKKTLQHGLDDLPNHCSITPGIPVKPMLAHPTKSLTDVLNRFEGNTFTCEFKYDGERNQVFFFFFF